jgi:hypothetical protein
VQRSGKTRKYFLLTAREKRERNFSENYFLLFRAIKNDGYTLDYFCWNPADIW